MPRRRSFFGALLKSVRPASAPVKTEAPEELVQVSGMTVDAALSDLDAQRIIEIKKQIAAGTYLTDDKLAIALDRMMADLREEPSHSLPAGHAA